MTPISTEWRGMDNLPAPDAPVYFVRLGHVFCGFFRRNPDANFSADGHRYWLTGPDGVTNWMPRDIPEPPLPKPDAFALWSEDPKSYRSLRNCWDAATEAERARFAAGVETLIGRIQEDNSYYYGQFYTDLRALAKGAA